MAQGGKRAPVPDGGKTMQLDAVVDELEEVALPPNLAAPPPLPPKKTSKGMVIVGVVIVLLAAGLGIGAGAFLMGTSDAPEATAEAATPEATGADEVSAPADDEEGEADIVQIDEVVVGAE